MYKLKLRHPEALTAIAEALTLAAKFYNEDQPRDENGRWSDGGGGGNYPNEDRIGDLKGKALPDHLRVIGPKGYNEKDLKSAMDRVPEAGKDLQKFTDSIKERFGIPPQNDSGLNFKSEGSAIGKALVEMGGNVAGIKDMVRNTIMPDDFETVERVGSAIKNEVEKMGGRVKFQTGPGFMGYRGYLVNVPASNGLMTEMQINTPEMLYAKDGHFPHIAKMIGEDRFNAIKKATGLEPGMGHKYYEQARKMPEGAEKDAVVKKSQEYYANFYKKLG